MSLSLLISTYFLIWESVNGAFLTPIAYTLPAVMPVSGSNANGGCPTPCVGMVEGISTCDCGTHSTLGQESITGVLIDGVIPTIDTVERNIANQFVWAAPLFTMRASTDTITLGFQFSASVVLQEVQLYMFHCPAWGIGAGTIRIHNGATFPQFFQVFSSIGSVTVANDVQGSCASLTQVSIPLQMARNTQNYFIEFTIPPGDQIEWVHIAGVRFSDQPIATDTLSTGGTTEQLMVSTEVSNTEQIITGSATTENVTGTMDTSVTNSSPSTDIISSTSSPSDTTNNSDEVTTPKITPESSTGFLTSLSTAATAQSSTFLATVVGVAVGVIVALIIIIVALASVIIVGCIVSRRKQSYRTEVEHLQDVVLERNNTENNFKLEPVETEKAEDSHYQKTLFDSKMRSQSSPPVHSVSTGGVTITNIGAAYSALQGATSRAQQREESPAVDEAGYSDIALLDSSPNGTYDDVRGTEAKFQQHVTTTTSQEKQQSKPELQEEDQPKAPLAVYSAIVKSEPPFVPPKTPELYRDLQKGKDCQPPETEDQCYAVVDENAGLPVSSKTRADSNFEEGQEEEEAAYYTTIKDGKTATPTTTPTESLPLGDYSELEGDKDSVQPEDVYSEVSNAPDKRKMVESHVGSNSNLDDMENNPTYDCPYTLTASQVVHTQDVDAIYADPDAQTDSIYDVIYSEKIEPSMFVKSPERVTKKKESPLSESADEEEEEEEEQEAVYAPIYSLTSSMNNSSLLIFKPENIRKIKTLGTGFFGKVLLADTVGLSQKDLCISETDDDKTKPTRVAVKTLRLNPSTERKETFEKELKFMSRLSHQNVVQMLGACQEDSPFIVMEYMEKGDLNTYLQEFEDIVQGNAPPTVSTISVGTLVYMSAQIANAMKYLASRNYIHRDLATRNCLVGAESKIKVADFGMSKSLYESHYYIVKGHAVLPVRWMARECFFGKFSAKTDVWAFGVTMWEIFTLAKDIPYEDMDDSEVVADACKAHRQLLQHPNNCPEGVYKAMLMCWHRESHDRATFEKLHETLSAID